MAVEAFSSPTRVSDGRVASLECQQRKSNAEKSEMAGSQRRGVDEVSLEWQVDIGVHREYTHSARIQGVILDAEPK
jgi:hypothetical protein